MESKSWIWDETLQRIKRPWLELIFYSKYIWKHFGKFKQRCKRLELCFTKITLAVELRIECNGSQVDRGWKFRRIFKIQQMLFEYLECVRHCSKCEKDSSKQNRENPLQA